MCDWAIAELALNRLESGVKKLQEALKVCPCSQLAFHNLTAALLANRQLRGANLAAIQSHLVQVWDQAPWTQEYRPLLWMPYFLNLEFVGGKCNLKCRMCLGTNAEGRTHQLTYMSAERFRMMLAASPTISGLTLSASDSEPLLHPELEAVLTAARDHGVYLDIFTNGQMLNAKTARLLVESRTVTGVNFSIDAATPETYRKIHGANFESLVGKIEMLQAIKKEVGVDTPRLSFSFVAMADTIQELPDFVRLALRLGARRVLVGDLIGWDDCPSENHVATDNPRCFEFIREAQRLVTGSDLRLQLPERLICGPEPAVPVPDSNDGPGSFALSTSMPDNPVTAACKPSTEPASFSTCSWLSGVWVRQNGDLDPCCLVHNVADMGNVHDGALLHNDKFGRVKNLLLGGKVFRQCANQRMCQFVQQQRTAGIPLRFITREDLGDLCPPPPPVVDAVPACVGADQPT